MLTMALSPTDNTPWFTELYTGSVGTVNTSSPLGLSLSIVNNTGMFGNSIHLPNGSSYTISLSLGSSTQVELKSEVGNFTESIATTIVSPNSTPTSTSGSNKQTSSLSFNFSQGSGVGNFTSRVTIGNPGVKPGIYFVTISAQTSNVVVSRIIEIDAS